MTAKRQERVALAGRPPAYAKEIVAARQAGKVPARGEVIVAVDCWDWGKPRGSMARCLIPPGSNAADMEFGFLAGLDVLVAWSSAVTDGARLATISRALLAIQPRRLLLLDLKPDAQHPVQWIKSLALGIEIEP